jgi:uncharacterized membrane protein YfcA
MFDIATEIVLLLVLAAFLAGFIDAIAGGGGLITVPALLLAGLPPVEALATNKLQSLFGSGSSVIAYASKGHVDVRQQWPSALASAFASVAGALLATVLPSDVLNVMLPVLLVGIAIYFLVKPNMGDLDRAQRMTPFIFGLTIVPLIGFYDGAFGPGTGSFFMMAFVSLAGFGVLKATAHTKTLNFASNVGAFFTFALVGAIAWKIGLIMGVAQFIGARLGAGLAMKQGSRVIKPLLVTTCILLAVRLLMDDHNPLRVLIGV